MRKRFVGIDIYNNGAMVFLFEYTDIPRRTRGVRWYSRVSTSSVNRLQGMMNRAESYSHGAIQMGDVNTSGAVIKGHYSEK